LIIGIWLLFFPIQQGKFFDWHLSQTRTDLAIQFIKIWSINQTKTIYERSVKNVKHI
jgi:hypothetical protein